MFDFRKFGDDVKSQIKNLKTTQSQVARKCGFEQPALSLWLSGKRGLKVDVFQCIASQLGLNVSDYYVDDTNGFGGRIGIFTDIAPQDEPGRSADIIALKREIAELKQTINLISGELRVANAIISARDEQIAALQANLDFTKDRAKKKPERKTIVPTPSRKAL